MEKTEKYQPANGMEGDLFMQAFCYKCAKHEDGSCMILNKALSFDVKEDGFPEEWVYTPPVEGEEPRGCFDTARCTAFELAAVNPFETCEQSEGQNLIDDAFEPVVEIIKEVLADDGSHKCDTCSLEFATCKSTQVVFGIDIDPNATGKEADRVVTCGAFIAHNLADVVAYIPSDKDHIGPRFTRFLPVPVPQDMLASYAQEMARIHGTWVKTKLDAKAFAKSCKSVTDQCEERELELAEIINAGAVEEEIPVNWIFDYIHNIKRLIRLDTMEVVEEKTLEADDMQPDLLSHSLSNVPDSHLEEKTVTTEGDSGGDGEIGAQIEDLEGCGERDPDADQELVGEFSESAEGDISEGIKTDDLDKDWPEPGPRP